MCIPCRHRVFLLLRCMSQPVGRYISQFYHSEAQTTLCLRKLPICRVPDELRRHSLSDGVGGSYSTNLDRNRYGNDDQYLSTVIR